MKKRGIFGMGTDIRPEISKKNPYWISKHRYYELRHFVMQLPEWRMALKALDGFAKVPKEQFIFSSEISDPTAACAAARERITKKIQMVRKAAHDADPAIGDYILQGILNEWSYDVVRTKYNIPCSRDEYYILYRKFFWLLNQSRN